MFLFCSRELIGLKDDVEHIPNDPCSSASFRTASALEAWMSTRHLNRNRGP